jgi:hypothetical protein
MNIFHFSFCIFMPLKLFHRLQTIAYVTHDKPQ